MVWIKFLLSLVTILFAGTKLAHYGDIIAEKTGLGRVWIGLVLIAAVTSMPELVTGVSSTALIKSPDLALGTLLGSCLYNLTILAVLDVLHRGTPLLSAVRGSHIISAGMGVLLITIAAVSILAGEEFSGWTLGWVSIPSIVILILYLAAARQIFRIERKNQSELPQVAHSSDKEPSIRGVYLKFALVATAIIGAGIWLSFIGDEIAQVTGWDTSFVGSLFLAITTSMPELVVTVAAVRMGAIDMAIADILGANMLDIVGIFWADLFYTRGPILFQPRAVVSKTHLVTAALVAVMSLLVIVGLKFRQQRKTFIATSWYGPLLIGLYLLGAYAWFASGAAAG